ncbi:acetylornithine deacetylase/succinyl-diaminopimelate desuccinylase-like protein [Actinokineospora baliensis]|uniref:M20/M25/M40 family metallo-hydrolase n=1 Tax=Actinokineospora baliensis TaxID=547056 RepID=UPI001956174C|nr:M20/M25/M40 family metallo-hydrolase [Actinokineospora baliensis]MBM7774598.1 acetylornithine deacetylase/succinyl-diaminopimelate desuccinylase-like protein [Actinokineospora baliensis]
MIEPVERLCARMIRFDTTNRGHGQGRGERDLAELVADLLTDAGLKPVLLERAARRTNVVARVSGQRPDLPALLVQMHLDVVPADPDEWSVDPFGGEIRDGFVWGRGAVDMKDMCASVLTVLARWAEQGRAPLRDIVFAFVADEEDTGCYGAHWLVKDHPELFEGCVAAIGESGGYTVPVRRADGTLAHLYPVGTAERGTAHLLLTATGKAGHGSRRNDDNAVVKLVDALHRLSAHQWPVVLTPAVRAFIEQTAATLDVPVDWDDVDGTIARFGPAVKLVENTVRNSTRPTVLSAGYKVNVVPGVAQAQVDTRVLPGTEEWMLSDIDNLLGPGIRREFIANQPPVQSAIDSPWFDAMADAIRANDPSAVVVPYCMGGGTDAKAFSKLGIECYGFAPLMLPEGFDYRSMAHGVDERVPVEGLRFGVEVLDGFLSR